MAEAQIVSQLVHERARLLDHAADVGGGKPRHGDDQVGTRCQRGAASAAEVVGEQTVVEHIDSGG